MSDWWLYIVTPFPWVLMFILIDIAEQLFSGEVEL